MSDQNVRNAAADSPAAIDEIEVEPLKDQALEEVSGGAGSCSMYHCSVSGEPHDL